MTCDHADCTPVTCSCGSQKGSCGCCDFCNKCAGETCIRLHQDRCEEGYECKLNDPDAIISQGAPGTCVASTGVAHDHEHDNK
ncbi:unnamed protein product [Ixodes hexagonus]